MATPTGCAGAPRRGRHGPARRGIPRRRWPRAHARRSARGHFITASRRRRRAGRIFPRVSVRDVLLYTTADGGLAKAMEVFPRHEAHMKPFIEDGRLTAIGTFGDPQAQGSMAIFTTREAAEAFAAEDPFVLEGVVGSYEIRDWNDALT